MVTVTSGIKSFTISWAPLNIPDIAGYVVCGINGTDENFIPAQANILNIGPESSFTYYTTQSGTYKIKVAGFDTFSNPKALILSDLNFSAAHTATIALTDPLDIIAPDTPTGLSLGSGLDTIQARQDSAYIAATWVAPSDPTEDLAGYSIQLKKGAESNYTEYAVNKKDTLSYKLVGLPPNVSYSVRIAAFDKWGNVSGYSNWVTITTAKDSTAPTDIDNNSVVLTGDLRKLIISWSGISDTDLAGYEVYISTTLGFTPNSSTLVFKGLATQYTYDAAPGQIYYVRIRAFDFSGNYSNYTNEKSATVSTVNPLDTTPPAVPTGLSLSTTSYIDGNSDSFATVTAMWNANSDLDFSQYEVRVKPTGGNYVYSLVSTNSGYTFNAQINTTYYVGVRAIDVNGNKSAFSSDSSITSAKNTTAPNAPTSLSGSSAFKSVFLSWTNPINKDLSRVDVYRNTSNNSSTAIKIGSVLGANYTDGNLTSATTYYYWVKAVNTSETASSFSTGTSVVTATDPSYFLSVLNGQLTASELGTTLTNRINLVDVGANSLVNKVNTLNDTTSNLQVQINDIISAPYDNTTAYVVNDKVTYQGRLYKCILASTGNLPTNTTYWQDLGTYTSLIDSINTVAGDLAILDGQVNDTGGIASKTNTMWTALYDPSTGLSAVASVANGASTWVSTNGTNVVSAANNYSSLSTTVAGNTSALAVESSVRASSLAPTYDPANTYNVDATVTYTNAGVTKIYRCVTQITVPEAWNALKWVEVTSNLYAQHVVKTDVNGYVSGFGLANNGTSSEFSIVADKFSIAPTATDPASADGSPFYYLTAPTQVNGVTVPSGAYLKKAFISDATIGKAQIADLSVDTAKIDTLDVGSVKITGTLNADRIAAASIDIGKFNGATQTKVNNGDNAFSGTANYRSDTNPQNDAVIAAISVNAQGKAGVESSDGNVQITVNYTYTQGTPKADQLFVYIKEGGGAISTADPAYATNAVTGSITFVVKPATTYSFGVQAVRRTESGLIGRSSIPTTASVSTIDANYTGNLNNTPTNTVVTYASNGQTVYSDPAARINAVNTTKINPGLILISGSTTLYNWMSGTDNTKINGGSIATNSVTANKLVVGSRNVTFDGVAFSVDKITNIVSWTSGIVSYVNDAGAITGASISASSITCTSGTYYFYWVKDSFGISVTTSKGLAFNASNLVLATYVVSGQNLVVTYAKTIIDGSDITTNTVTADKLTTSTLQATTEITVGPDSGGTVKISGTNHRIELRKTGENFDRIQLGALTGGGFGLDIRNKDNLSIFNADGDISGTRVDSLGASKITTGTLSASATISIADNKVLIDGTNSQFRINDGTYDRVKIGKLATGSYGISIVDANNNPVLSADGTLNGAKVSNLIVNGQAIVGGSVTIGAANITYSGGATLDSLKPASAGADVTSTVLSTGTLSIGAALQINNYLDITGSNATLRIGRSSFDTTVTTAGLVIGKEGSTPKALFYKDADNYFKYDATNGVEIRGPLNASDITSGVLNTNLLNIGMGANLCPNSDFSGGNYLWTLPSAANINAGINGAGSSWAPNGINVLSLNQTDAATSPTYYEAWSALIPIEPNKYYGLSAYTGAHRANVDVFIYWLNSAPSIIGNTWGPDPTNWETASGGTLLSGYKRTFSSGQAPATAAYARIVLRKNATKSGGDSWLFVTRVMLEEITANTTTPSPWSPAGVSTISGDQIKTGLIQSNNWTTTTGSQFDLIAGTLKVGGSTSPKFSVDASGNMTCTGAAISGTVIANELSGQNISIRDNRPGETVPYWAAPSGTIVGRVSDPGTDSLTLYIASQWQTSDINGIITKHTRWKQIALSDVGSEILS